MKVEILYQPAYSVARVTLQSRESIQVESGAMVGMSPELEMETQAKGGFLKSISRSMFGGEGLVVELTGPGKVNLQSRSQDAFLSWLIPLLPKQSSHSS
jgi:uncharacterized protein (AIM24 family)